jgi:hypothetical protein
MFRSVDSEDALRDVIRGPRIHPLGPDPYLSQRVLTSADIDESGVDILA